MEKLIAVFLGGGLGAVTRYVLTFLLPSGIELFPFATLFANFLGCFIATVVFSYFILKGDNGNIYKTPLHPPSGHLPCRRTAMPAKYS